MMRRTMPLTTITVGLLLASVVALVLTMPGAAGAHEGRDLGCKGDIVLDAGHGGTDTGAVNNKWGLVEKEQNLIVAKRLHDILQSNGHVVCMTRTADQTLSNNDRYTYANTTGAKVLVSVHMNGSSDPSVDYTITLFGKPRKDQELAQTVLDKGLYPALGIPKKTPYQFASGVLLKSTMPAIIAESVFITSDQEGEWLAQGRPLSDGTKVSRQEEIAVALSNGIEAYLAIPR